MNQVREVERLNDKELAAAARNGGKWELRSSWHAKYLHSAYVFCAGFPFDMTEGDLIVVFSQFGQVVDINLVRDAKTGKSRGFCFIAYEDVRSTVLAVDNLNGAHLLGRTLRVDHCEDYRDEMERKPRDDDNARAASLDESAENRAKEAERLERNEEIRTRREQKAELFAKERGQFTDADLAAAQVSARAAGERDAREAAVLERMRERIERTQRAHRSAVEAELSAEQQRERDLRERREKQDEERRAIAKAVAATGGPELGAGGRPRPGAAANVGPGEPLPLPALRSTTDVDGGAGAHLAATRPGDEDKFERMMRGAKARAHKRKKPKASAEAAADRAGADGHGTAGRGTGAKEPKRAGEVSVSVEETDRMRKDLGLAPLRR